MLGIYEICELTHCTRFQSITGSKVTKYIKPPITNSFVLSLILIAEGRLSHLCAESSLLTVQEVGSHQKLQSNLRLDWELRDLRSAVCVSVLVGKVHADFTENV